MPIPNLETLAVGSPITRLGVSFFPLYLAANDLPPIATGAASGLVIDELDQASVQSLRVRNPGARPVLVVEGEHFLGGKQNRALNATVLVPARAELEIPVSCLERGRWGHRQEYRRDDAFAAAPVRAAQQAGVARSMGSSGSREGDQSAVWRAVERMLARTEVKSSTAAAADVRRQAPRREPSRAAAAEQLATGGPLPGQCGIVVTHGLWVQAMDLFGAPDLLAVHWPALIRSYLLESPVVQGRPSATRVLDLARRFASAPGQEAPGVGLGVEHRVADKRLVGQALTLHGAIVHAAFFTTRTVCRTAGGVASLTARYARDLVY